MTNTSPIPVQDPMVDKGGYCSDTWVYYLSSIVNTANSAPARVAMLPLTGQHASIAPSDVGAVISAAGLYRLCYFARITTVGSVSSSLTVTLSWTDHGVVQSFSGTAMTGNLTTTAQTGTLLIYSDAASPVTYATTYASNAADGMRYQLYVTLESVAA